MNAVALLVTLSLVAGAAAAAPEGYFELRPGIVLESGNSWADVGEGSGFTASRHVFAELSTRTTPVGGVTAARLRLPYWLHILRTHILFALRSPETVIRFTSPATRRSAPTGSTWLPF